MRQSRLAMHGRPSCGRNEDGEGYGVVSELVSWLGGDVALMK